METASLELRQNILCVRGPLNFTTVASLWRESQAQLAALPVWSIDLAAVTTSNSAGIALLLEWVKAAKHQQKKIQFANIPAQLTSIIEVFGLESFFNS